MPGYFVRRRLLFFLLALIAAAASALSVRSYLYELERSAGNGPRLAEIVVAAADLEAGSVLDADSLRVEVQTAGAVPSGSVASVEEAVGMTLTVPVFAGDPITRRKIGETTGRSGGLPPGMRAYSLGLAPEPDEPAVPRPGDRVDVIATFTADVFGQPAVVTVLRHKLVLHGAGAGTKKSGEDPAARTVLLMVGAEEAERLAMAEALGKITVVVAPSAEEPSPEPSPPGFPPFARPAPSPPPEAPPGTSAPAADPSGSPIPP